MRLDAGIRSACSCESPICPRPHRGPDRGRPQPPGGRLPEELAPLAFQRRTPRFAPAQVRWMPREG
jgi:hypothetical protein